MDPEASGSARAVSAVARRTVVFVAILLSYGCKATPAEKEEEGEREEHSDLVRLSPEGVKRSDIRLSRVAKHVVIGGIDVAAEVSLNPDLVAAVAPLVSGQVVTVYKTVGDRVAKRQALAQIASVDVARARSELRVANATVRLSRADLRRQHALAKEGLGAKRNLVRAENSLARSRATQTAAWSRLKVYGGHSGGGADLMVRSPLAGQIIERHATKGEIVGPKRSLFVVADLSRVWVIGRVFEQDIAAVRLHAPVSVTLAAYPGRSWPGTIGYVGSVLDEKTRTLAIRVELSNPHGLLRPGLSGTIAMSPPDAPRGPILALPERLVTSAKGRTIVFVPGTDPGEFRARPVKLGIRGGGFVQIRAGLSEGDEIVSNGMFILKSELLSESMVGDDD